MIVWRFIEDKATDDAESWIRKEAMLDTDGESIDLEWSDGSDATTRVTLLSGLTSGDSARIQIGHTGVIVK